MKLRTIAPHVKDSPERPFLKWAGAKTQLLPKLRPFFPAGEHRFIEPFVGSGVVFLNSGYRRSVLSDSNHDIINLYAILKKRPREFIRECQSFFTGGHNSEEQYYELREEFNLCRDLERRASIFLYLNRHCFNGLCRYNQKGRFNTPFGRYERVYFPEKEMEHFAAKLKGAELVKADFRTTLARVGKGDVVYCDPPYVPLTATANFTSYAMGGFSLEDHEDLSRLANQAASRGATVILSNHDTPFTQKLYEGAAIQLVMVSRTISCDGQNRKKAKEIIAVFGQEPAAEWRLSA